MNRAEFARAIETYLPDFLSRSSYAEVISQLDGISDLRDYYWCGEKSDENNMLQGDAWEGVPIVSLANAERKCVNAVILSNSCDIDPTNSGRPHKKVVVSPLIKLSDYEKLLKEKCDDEKKNNQRISTLRSQKTSNILWLPGNEVLNQEEKIVLLDDLYSIPLSMFRNNARRRMFRLNNAGFYIFLLKISIHFTRFLEKVDRSDNN